MSLCFAYKMSWKVSPYFASIQMRALYSPDLTMRNIKYKALFVIEMY